MIFDFSLCATFLLATLVVYFRSRLGKLSELRGLEPPEDSKVCYCQY